MSRALNCSARRTGADSEVRHLQRAPPGLDVVDVDSPLAVQRPIPRRPVGKAQPKLAPRECTRRNTVLDDNDVDPGPCRSGLKVVHGCRGLYSGRAPKCDRGDRLLQHDDPPLRELSRPSRVDSYPHGYGLHSLAEARRKPLYAPPSRQGRRARPTRLPTSRGATIPRDEFPTGTSDTCARGSAIHEARSTSLVLQPGASHHIIRSLGFSLPLAGAWRCEQDFRRVCPPCRTITARTMARCALDRPRPLAVAVRVADHLDPRC